MEKLSSRKLAWLDILRGIAVLLVIIHHSGFPILGRFILAFHMPLFFFISGFLYRHTLAHKTSFMEYFTKNFRRLMIPYFLYLIIDFLIQYAVSGGNFNLKADLVNRLYYMHVFWFIPCLFVAHNMFHLLHKSTLSSSKEGKETFYFVIAVSSIFFSYTINKVTENYLPITLDMSFMALAFLAVGTLLYRPGTSLFFSLQKRVTLLLVSFFGLTIFVYLNYKFADGGNFMMYVDEYGIYPVAVLGAIFGVLFTGIVVRDLSESIFIRAGKVKKYLLILSEYSLFIFPLHLWVLQLSKYICEVLEISRLTFVLHFIVINIAIIPICLLVGKYIPVLAGKSRKPKTANIQNKSVNG
jgi:acyltransferase